jgi:hypothetical protein
MFALNGRMNPLSGKEMLTLRCQWRRGRRGSIERSPGWTEHFGFLNQEKPTDGQINSHGYNQPTAPSSDRRHKHAPVSSPAMIHDIERVSEVMQLVDVLLLR